MSDISLAFRSALAQAGIPMDAGQILIDDNIHRYRTKEDKEANSWYVLHLLPSSNGGNPIVVGAAGCWKRNLEFKWCSVDKTALSKQDWSAIALSQRDLAAKRAQEDERAKADAKAKCNASFASFPKAEPGSSIYLIAKGVPEPHGPLYISSDPITNGWLALPLQDSKGVIHSAQYIADDGTKRFQYQGRVQGCYFPVSDIPGGPILICEGYATGASLFEATGWTVICAMNAGNLAPVCKDIRALYPLRTIIVCADNDAYTEGNPGVAKGEAAAKSIKAHCAWPEFGDSVETKVTDFNDLHQLSGLAEVARQVTGVLPIVGTPIGLLRIPEKDDPTELLRYRYLCECGGLLFNGPTGVGKSSLAMQSGACWTNYLPFFGITPTKPLKIVLIQAENDEGDLAEMRNGICYGLDLNEDQRRTFFENYIVYSATKGITGEAFCKEVIRPLLDLHNPNILQIDPMLSFLGGDVKDQETVGAFLRVYLNPELSEHRCGSMLFHHTNKPPGSKKDRPEWTNGEMAYMGSGSAEWANWARAVISLQSLGKSGYYRMHGGKRGARINWRDSNDELLYQKEIAWSKDGYIYWREPSQSEVAEVESELNQKTKSIRVPDDFLGLLEPKSLTKAEWTKLADSKLKTKRATAYRWIEALEADDRVLLSIATGRYSIILSQNYDQPSNDPNPPPKQDN